MSKRYFLVVEGVDGGSQSALCKGGFELSDFQFDISVPAGGGNTPDFEKLCVELDLPSASPALREILLKGETLSSIQIKCFGPTGKLEYDLRLGDVVIDAISEGGEGSDKILFDYVKVDLTTVPHDATGKAGTPSTFTWDRQLNEAGASVAAPMASSTGTSNAPEGTRYFLCVGGIDGGSVVPGAEGAFELTDFDFDLDAIEGIGGADASINLSLLVTKNLPELAGLITGGQTIDLMQIKCISPDGTLVSDLRLGDVTVNGLETTGNEGSQLSLDFKTFDMRNTPVAPDGTAGTPQTFRWDFENSQELATPLGTPTVPQPEKGVGIDFEVKYYLLIDGLDGGSRPIHAPGGFELEDFAFSVSQPTGGGNPFLTDVSVSLMLGSVLSEIAQNAAAGTDLGHVQFKCVRDNGEVLYDLRLEGVKIASVEKDEQGTDRLTFSYDKISLTTTPIKSDSSLGTPSTWGFDKETGMETGQLGAATPVTNGNSTADTALTYFLLIDGMDGGATGAGVEGGFALNSFDFGIGTEEPTALTDIAVEMLLGSAQPQLLAALNSGQVIDSIQIKCINQAGDVVSDLILNDVRLESLQQGPDGVGSILFDYAKIQLTSTPVNADASLGTPRVFSWDRQTNAAASGVTEPTPSSDMAALFPQTSYFMLVDGIDGGSGNPLAPNAFEIDGFNLSLSRLIDGDQISEAQLEDILVELGHSTALPLLLAKASAGETIDLIQIKCITPDGKTLYDLRLADVTIPSVTDNGIGTDGLSMHYGKMTVETFPLQGDGSLGPSQKFSFDRENAEAGEITLGEPQVADQGAAGFAEASYFLFIDGIAGNARSAHAQGGIAIDDFSFSVLKAIAAGGGTGTPLFQDLLVTLDLGSFAPEIADKLARGETLDAVQIKCITPEGEVLYDLRLGDATITSKSDHSSAKDTIGFAFNEVEVITAPGGAGGATEQVFRWNLQTNSAGDGVTPPAPIFTRPVPLPDALNDIFITELFPDRLDLGTSPPFIELFNNGTAPIDLSGGVLGMPQVISDPFQVDLPDLVLPPGETVILVPPGTDIPAMAELWCLPPHLFQTLPEMPDLDPLQGILGIWPDPQAFEDDIGNGASPLYSGFVIDTETVLEELDILDPSGLVTTTFQPQGFDPSNMLLPTDPAFTSLFFQPAATGYDGNGTTAEGHVGSAGIVQQSLPHISLHVLNNDTQIADGFAEIGISIDNLIFPLLHPIPEQIEIQLVAPPSFDSIIDLPETILFDPMAGPGMVRGGPNTVQIDILGFGQQLGNEVLPILPSHPGMTNDILPLQVMDPGLPAIINDQQAFIVEEGGTLVIPFQMTQAFDVDSFFDIGFDVNGAGEFTGSTLVSVAAGQTEGAFHLDVVDDALLEGDKTISGSITSGALTQFNFNVTLRDDERSEVITPISAVNGPGGTPPLLFETVTVEGMVSYDGQFFDHDLTKQFGVTIQTADGEGDMDPGTSEGITIFNFSPSNFVNLEVGDRVQITGEVRDEFGLTAIFPEMIHVLSHDNILPQPIPINLRQQTIFFNAEGQPQPLIDQFSAMRTILNDQRVRDNSLLADRGVTGFGSDLPPGVTDEFPPSQPAFQSHLENNPIVFFSNGTPNIGDRLGGDAIHRLTDSNIITPEGAIFPTIIGPMLKWWLGQGTLDRVQILNSIDGENRIIENPASTLFPDFLIDGDPDREPPAPLFRDGFESGDTTAWSMSGSEMGRNSPDPDNVPAAIIDERRFKTQELFVSIRENGEPPSIFGVQGLRDLELAFAMVEGMNDAFSDEDNFLFDLLLADQTGLQPGQTQSVIIYNSIGLSVHQTMPPVTINPQTLSANGISANAQIFEGPNPNDIGIIAYLTDEISGESFRVVSQGLAPATGQPNLGFQDSDQDDGAGVNQSTRLEGAQATLDLLDLLPGAGPAPETGDNTILLMDFNSGPRDAPQQLFQDAGFIFPGMAPAQFTQSENGFLSLDAPAGFSSANSFEETGSGTLQINSLFSDGLAPGGPFTDPVGARLSGSDISALSIGLFDQVSLYDPFGPEGRISRASDPQGALDQAAARGMDVAEVFMHNPGAFSALNERPVVLFSAGDRDGGSVSPPPGAPNNIFDLEVTLTGNDQIVIVDTYDFDTLINATITGSANNDTIAGAEGDDVLRGGEGDDLLLSEEGENLLDGGDGNDVIFGGDGNDVIIGGDGDDQIQGNEGDDLLTGGAGADTFVILPGDGNDTITDFDLLLDKLQGGSFSFEAFNQSLLNADTGSAILTFEDGSTLTVQGDGVTPETLRAANNFLNPAENPNALLMGQPLLSGTALEDETLTVDVSGVSDADGIVEGSESIQWRRDGVDVAGATGTTYLLTQADVGSHLSVRFSYLDGAGKNESVFSTASDAVENVNDFIQGVLVLAGDPQVGNTLTAQIDALSDEDGIDESTITYQWNRADSLSQPVPEVIQGATGQSYTLTEADQGKFISVIFRYDDDFGNSGARSSVAVSVNAPPEGDIILVGTIEEDTEITADVSGITDPDGILAGSESFQWFIDAQPVTGATGASFTPLQEHVGGILRVDYTFEDLLGMTHLVQATALTPVANVNDPPEGDVIQSGFQLAGTTLTADVSGVTDEDGIRPDSQVFEWRRADDAAGTNSEIIAGEIGSTYVTTEADLSSFITATFRYTDFGGAIEEVTSNAVTGNAPPQGDVIITGLAEQNQILTADGSGVTDADAIVPGSETYQWRRDGVDIPDATDATHILRQDDVNAVITVVFGYTDGLGNTETVLSGPTDPVANVNDLPSGVISGFQFGEVGVPIEYDFSGISDPDGIDESTISYSWIRQDTSFANVGEIAGADTNIYVPTEADLGFYVTPIYRYTDLFGTEESLQTRGPFMDQAPSGFVGIIGEVIEGNSLTADLSTIVEPDGIDEGTIDYQWLRDGDEIVGATEESYTPVASDVGTEISVQVDYRDLGRKSETFVSATQTVIEAAPLTLTGTPGDDPLASLTGGFGRDTILGLEGDDQLSGGPGDDFLDGGEGIDTGVFAGERGSYTLTLSPTSTEIEDRRGDGTGMDSLTSVELLEFADQTLNLDIFDGPTGLTAEQFSEIIELYIAYFNRAPDALGLYYWATEFSNGFTVPDMAANFFGQPETQATYASVLDDQGQLDVGDAAKVGDFVTAVYNNVLGRGPDTPGFDYWVGELTNNPAITPGVFILAIIGGAKNPGNPTPQTALDQAYLATKSDLGAYFSVIKGMSDVSDAVAAMALFSAADVEASRDATIAAIDGHYADALDPLTGDFLMPLIGVIDDPFGVV